ncbi:MAG: PAS domain S-box protein [Bacteroidetes bacterium]|nr:PAS domain S-box protein [Bacteroidota bacterium]
MSFGKSIYLEFNEYLIITNAYPESNCRLLQNPEQVKDQSVWITFPSLQAYKYEGFLKKCIQESKPVTFENYAPEYSAWLRWMFYPKDNGLGCLVTDITSEIEEQKQLLDYEIKMAALLENTHETILFLSPDCTIINFNNTAFDRIRVNLNKELLIGASFKEYIYPGYESDFYEAFHQALKGETRSTELRINLQGRDYFIHSTHTPLYDAQERIAGVTIVSSDISDRKLAELSKEKNEMNLSEMEIKLKSILDSTQENIVLLSNDYKILCYNKTAEITFKSIQNKSICEGDDFRNYVIDENKAEFLKGFETAKSGQHIVIERPGAKGAGDSWFEHKFSPAYDNNGQLIGVTLVSLNITQRKLAEEQLKISETKYRDLFTNSPTCNFIWEPETLNILEVNDAVIEKYGYTKSEWSKMTVLDFRPAEDREKVKESIAGMATSGYHQHGRWRHIKKSGEEILMDVTSYPIIYNNKPAVLTSANDVTELEVAIGQLKKSKDRFLRVLQKSPLAKCITLKNNKVIYFNDQFVKLFGYTIEDIPYLDNWWPLAYPDIQYREYIKGEWTKRINDVKSANGFEPFEASVRCKDGSFKDIEFNYADLGEEYVVVFKDITESKKAEKLIRISEARYKSIISVSNTGAWEYHIDTGFLWCSAEYFSMLGRDVNDYDLSGNNNLQQTWLDLLHPEDKARASNHFAAYLKNGSIGIYENYFRMLHSNGEWVWIWSRGQTLRDADGVITTLTVGTHIDITQRKQAEIAIKQSEEKFRNIIEFNPLPMLIINEELNIAFSNPAACNLLGYTNEELSSLSLKDLSSEEENGHEDLLTMRERQLQNYVKGEVIELRKKDGEHFFAEAKFGTFESDAEGYTVLTLHDVSDRIKFEIDITKYNHELNLLNEINDNILNSHSEFQLYDRVCETLIGDDAYCLAWIGLPPEAGDTEGIIKPISNAGVITYLKGINLSVTNPLTKNGPTATALMNGTTVVTNNTVNTDYYKPWSERVKKYGIGSSVALPVKYNDDIFAVLNVYSPSPGAFDKDEVKILDRLASNLAVAVKGIKNKQEKEKTAYQLNERVKEIKTIYEVSSLLKEEELEFTEILSDVVNKLPNGLQFPDNCGALICFNEACYQSALYKSSEFSMRSVKKADDGKLLQIEMVYLTETPHEHEGPFLKEERDLLDNVTELLITFYNKSIIRQKLKTSEANLNSVFENTEVGHLLIDKAYNIISFNNSFKNGYAAISGIHIDLQQKITELLPDPRKDRFIEILESVKQKKMPYSYDIAYSYNKRNYHFNMNIVPVLDNNELNGYSISAYDITALKKLETERQKIIDDLLQRNRDLEQFSYIVSHNIRSPLATLLGFSNLLKSGMNEKEMKFVFKGLEESALKLDNTIKDVNEILNIKKEISQSKVRVNLNELVQSVLGSLDTKLKSTGAIIDYDFKEISEINTIKPYIQSVFINLITNAIKYARRGVRPELFIYSTKQDANVIITFKDNGTGIDLAKYGDQLFGLYKRFNLDVEGKGMGLYMVKTQIGAMGGSIDIESKLGEGSTFIVKLPL